MTNSSQGPSSPEVGDAPHILPRALMHGLRTPLNQTIGYSELLIELAEQSGRRDFVPDLEKIRAAGHQLLRLINANFKSIQGSDAGQDDVGPEAQTPPLGEARTTPEIGVETRRPALLVVDDVEANRDVLSKRLESQGYSVTTAGNGVEALESLRLGQFDLVLLDIMMPEMDGYEVLQRLKADEVLQHIPVIMISALDELDSAVRCIELGAVDYLPKPFNPILLKARIASCLEKKLAHDREMQLHQQLKQNFQRLQELEKVRDDLTHMIIHDMRTPLTSVIAGMQTLEVVGDLNEDQHKMMGISVIGGQTLLAMINDLLDVDKSESGSMELDFKRVSAAEIVESAICQIASLAQLEELMLIRQVDGDLPEFEADQNKLIRILVNLIGNAIKFTQPGGAVTIEAHRSKEGELAVFSVKDTGEGIPPEAFERIFEKFGQVESRKGGRVTSTGLGLTFCKLAAEAHGGQIGVDSVQGQGSTFWFSIPLGAPVGRRALVL